MITRSVGSLLFAVTLLGLAPLARAGGVDMTEAQFKTYHDYLDALKDPRVQKLKAAKRLPAIAGNFHIAVPKLKAIVKAGDDLGGAEGIAKLATEAVEGSVAGTPLEGRLGEVRVDTTDAHVVAYVSWKADKGEALEQEACLLAARSKKAAPISADLRLWATDPKDQDHKMFDGMITGEAALNIREARIADFATTRYIKLFEHVKIDRQ
jgi:hypothetical protein